MKSVGIVLGSIAVGLTALIACNGQTDVPVVQSNGDNLHALDAGSGKCGNSACGAGELCCESADESCAPTCTKVAQCPVYGRPCKVDSDGGGPETDAGTIDSGGTTLTWRETCGDPVCKAPAEDAGPPVQCPALGSSCTEKGEACGNPNLNCGAIQVCDDHDLKAGGCPISTKKAKQDISYVDDAALQRLHDETLQMRLATYRYKGNFIDPRDPNAQHLGFIIEDQPQSASVERGHDRVDLYGYMSMAVATMQVQEKEIADLRRELDGVKKSCKR